MSLSQSTLTVLTLLALVVAIVAVSIAVGQGQRLRHMRRSYSVRQRSHASPSDAGELGLEMAELREAVVQAIRRVGMVRFDAFEDMGGKLSFAVALLDEEGTGVVFCSINGRSETRVYAKPIERGTSRIDLSEEEEEAIRRALVGVTA